MVGVCLVQLTFHRGKQNIRGHNGKEVGRGYKLLETGKKTHFGLNLDPSSQGPFPSHYGLTTTQPICCSFLPPPPKSIKCLHGVSKMVNQLTPHVFRCLHSHRGKVWERGQKTDAPTGVVFAKISGVMLQC